MPRNSLIPKDGIQKKCYARCLLPHWLGRLFITSDRKPMRYVRPKRAAFLSKRVREPRRERTHTARQGDVEPGTLTAINVPLCLHLWLLCSQFIFSSFPLAAFFYSRRQGPTSPQFLSLRLVTPPSFSPPTPNCSRILFGCNKNRSLLSV